MFFTIISKIKNKGGEKNMKGMKIAMVFALALGLGLIFGPSCFAARITSAPLTVTAVVPTLNTGLSVTVTPVQVTGNVFGTPGGNTITLGDPATGQLVPDFANSIFTSPIYYAVDVAVIDNTGNPWYITTSISSIKRGTTTDNLDSNLNVTYVKILTTTDATGKKVETPTQIQKTTFAQSGVSSTTLLNSTALSGQFLRIYYGLATGVVANDASGASPILLTKPAGTYTGGVTITLTP